MIDLKSTELYIPIWLYSNLTLTSWIISMPTLHSNLVIFKCTRFGMFSKFHQCFTFQSGYIQILSPYSIENNPICFTFQSGYIQMVDRWRPKKNGRTFTFQSGYIQMGFDVVTLSSLIVFTFQSGYIQMGFDVVTLSSLIVFTFQSGYIQMIVANIVDYITAISLHSNLVIFKCRPTCLRCGRCVPLHSNLVIFKWYIIALSTFLKSFFTFQSGYIQIE